MKKVIIGMLILIPLIIVASVFFAIDIIAVEAYIAIDRVELSDTSLVLSLSDSPYTALTATVYPARAKEEHKKIIWTIENQSGVGDDDVADIDKDSGEITLLAYGTFTVVATTASGNKTARCEVYVKSDKVNKITLASTKADFSYVTGERERLVVQCYPLDAKVTNLVWSSSDPAALDVDQNGIVTAKKVSNGFVEIKATSGDVQESIHLKVAKGDPVVPETGSGYEIENADLLAGVRLRVGKQPFALALKPKGAYQQSIKAEAFTSSDHEVATIDGDGVITANAAGFVRFAAKLGGQEVAALELEVVESTDLIVLNKSARADRKGIAATTYYGAERRNESGAFVPNTMALSAVFPQGVNNETHLNFATDRTDLVSIAANGVITFLPNSSKTPAAVTITVSAKQAPYDGVVVSRQYTFYTLDGVDCYTYSDVLATAQQGKNILLHQDITLLASDGGIVLTSNLYGNGHMIDGMAVEKTKNSKFELVRVAKSGVLVSNINLKSDVPENINLPNGLQGTVLHVESLDGSFLEDVRIEYSILENGYYCAKIEGAAAVLEGNILRNASNFGLHTTMEEKKSKNISLRSDIVMKNNVMSNIVAPAVGITAESDLSRAFVPSTFKVEGFIDIYNWQDISSLKMLDRDLIEGNPGTNTALKNILNSALRTEIAKERYDGLRYRLGDTDYFHLGIITAGAIFFCPTVPDITEAPQLQAFDIAAVHDGTIGFRLDPCILYNYNNQASIVPGDEPVEDAVMYARLRGE